LYPVPSPNCVITCKRRVRHRAHSERLPVPAGGGGGKERVGYNNLGDFEDVDSLIESFSSVEDTRLDSIVKKLVMINT
jgi:hypothetical protein